MLLLVKGFQKLIVIMSDFLNYFNFVTSSSTRIILQCDHHEEGKLESVTESVTSSTSVQIVSSGCMVH